MGAQEKFENQTLFQFLIKKMHGYSFKKIVYLEIESLSFWLFKNIPGIIGFLIRNLILKIFSKSKKGMVSIQPEVNLVNVNKIEFGANIGINSGTYINALGGIKFGNYVLIGSNVTISSGIHEIMGKFPPVFARPCEPSSINIEDDVWLGAGVVIMPGITLKKGTVVGANSVVTKSTEEYGIYVGSPARKVKSRINEQF